MDHSALKSVGFQLINIKVATSSRMSIAEIETSSLGAWAGSSPSGRKQLTKRRARRQRRFVKQNHNYVAAGNDSRA